MVSEHKRPYPQYQDKRAIYLTVACTVYSLKIHATRGNCAHLTQTSALRIVITFYFPPSLSPKPVHNAIISTIRHKRYDDVKDCLVDVNITSNLIRVLAPSKDGQSEIKIYDVSSPFALIILCLSENRWWRNSFP